MSKRQKIRENAKLKELKRKKKKNKKLHKDKMKSIRNRIEAIEKEKFDMDQNYCKSSINSMHADKSDHVLKNSDDGFNKDAWIPKSETSNNKNDDDVSKKNAGFDISSWNSHNA